MVKRELWLKQIRPFYENELIKVLIGIRRCGKSIILNQIKEEILSAGVDESHIIFINFE
ncbi:AAA family ATPase, partial [uncultured Treponema sp.]